MPAISLNKGTLICVDKISLKRLDPILSPISSFEEPSLIYGYLLQEI